MSRINRRVSVAAGLLRRPAALFSLGFVLLFAQSGVQATGPVDALNFFKNYFITGGYAAGGTSTLVQEYYEYAATGSIPISGVPENVDTDILAAFLYVQTAEEYSGQGIGGAEFNGFRLDGFEESIAKALNPGATPCFSVDEGVSLNTYRADVLRFLPIDNNEFLPDETTKNPHFGKHVVNGMHSVELPSGSGTSSSYPQPVGASLVVVYRDPTQPLKAVVIYDGGATKLSGDTLSQTIQGFYQASSTSPVAQMTHIVSAEETDPEEVRLDGVLVATNPFSSTWNTTTFSGLPLTGNAASATVTVEPVDGGGCLSYSAIVFSTTVQDTDSDGLLDTWEQAHLSPLLDPNGQPLPNLNAMGARRNVKDIFVEINYMKTDVPLSYGDIEKPAHTHLPTLAALNMVGDAFKNAPVVNPNGSTGIKVHFDVGNNRQASPYVIPFDLTPANLARGGEAIDEMGTVCHRGMYDPPSVCQFSDYPGTVGWKTGFRFLRDAFVHDDGTELVFPADELLLEDCKSGEVNCRRRSDPNRKHIFHHVVFAHLLGLPKNPCLDFNHIPVIACEATDPDFHVPRTNTGVGDFPGGDFMVTLGAFDNADLKPIGTPLQVAGTLTHELGHNLGLRHGGPPVIDLEAMPPLVQFQPNCKPNLLSDMNYLFQLRGVINAAGVPKIDLSRQQLATLNEGFPPGLSEAAGLGSRPYRTSWFAPRAGSIAEALGTLAATKHCDGSSLGEEDAVVRIDGTSVTGRIDWNADGDTSDSGLQQDVNFTGGARFTALSGFNEWANIRLNQVAGRRNIGAPYLIQVLESTEAIVGPLSLDVGQGDLGQGDLGQGDLGQGDLGQGDLGQGDLGQGDLGQGDLGQGDLGQGDLGQGDLGQGRGDLGQGDLGTGDLQLDPGTGERSTGEIDLETFTAAFGNAPPTELTATPKRRGIRLRWQAPGNVVDYLVYRVDGSTVTPSSLKVLVATVLAPKTTVRDSSARTGRTYTYFVVAEYPDGPDDGMDLDLSGPSNFATAKKGDRDPDDDED